MGYTHLQIRSGFSIMKSSVNIDQLVQRAKELNYSSLALTDENVMYGVVPFYKACKAAGIKPIIGINVTVEITESTKAWFILLAKNNAGYQQLLKLTSFIQLNDGVIKQDDLSRYLTGIKLILPLSNPHFSELLVEGNVEHLHTYINRLKDSLIEGELYIGIQANQSAIFPQIREFCSNQGLSAVAIGDVRYIHPSDQQAYECLRAIDAGYKWSEQQSDKSQNNLYLHSEQEVYDNFNDWTSSVDMAGEIADDCVFEMDFNQRLLPSFPLPSGQSTANYLRKLCQQYITEKYNEPSKEVVRRLEYELQVINTMNFNDYFLIVWDFIRFAKQQGIMVGPGRGSAAGSLVAYLLGITNIDPIQYNLLFERFLNPERITMPDIDIDFSDYRRDEVIEYVKQKYGKEHVAQIITFGTFATRSLLRELFKTMDIDQQDAAFILKEIPAQGAKSVVESVKASDELTTYVKQSKKLQLLFKIASRLEGLPRHISTHAAGVVISEDALTEHVPLTSTNGDIYLTQFAMKELESIGLLKMDFLGLRNLNLIERILSTIKLKEKKEVILEKLPLNDQKTFTLLQQGKTNGVFQLESQGMQRVLQRLLPTHFEDVVAVNALYRPGPMEYIPVYINRKHGHEAVTYPHQDLKPILEDTYGVLVYQEQIMQIANKMAGFSLGQADILRRAVSKKQKELMIEQKELFVQGCKKNGYSQQVAEEIFLWIIRFSNYGFNRSHAVAYSMISYQLAYLKAHYPAHFLAEILSSVSGQQDKMRLYVKEAKDLNIQVLPPSINKSFGKFTVDRGNLRMGLLSIKGVGHQVVREIIRVRKDGAFKNLFDFCLRVPTKIINRQVIESLILAGAFDETYPNRASLLATIDQALEQGELFSEFEDQPSFFHNDIELDVSYIETDSFSDLKQLSFEKELIGFYLSSHPLSEYRKSLRSTGFLNVIEAERHVGKSKLALAAVIQEIKTIRTKRGDPMAFITLSDESGEMDSVIFPEQYREVHRWLTQEMLVFIKGKVEERNGKKQLIISELTPFDENELKHEELRRIFIKVNVEKEQATLERLRQIAQEFPGAVPIIVYLEQKKLTYQLTSEYYLKLNHACMQELISVFGKENVVLKKQ